MQNTEKAKHDNPTKEKGVWGERIAEEYLLAQGYTLLARNWRVGHLEVDLIMANDKYVAFIEVKTRAAGSFDPLDAVDKRKIRRLARAANDFMIQRKLPHYVRFDVFSVVGSPKDYKVEYIPDAFYPPLHSYR